MLVHRYVSLEVGHSKSCTAELPALPCLPCPALPSQASLAYEQAGVAALRGANVGHQHLHAASKAQGAQRLLRVALLSSAACRGETRSGGGAKRAVSLWEGDR